LLQGAGLWNGFTEAQRFACDCDPAHGDLQPRERAEQLVRSVATFGKYSTINGLPGVKRLIEPALLVTRD